MRCWQSRCRAEAASLFPAVYYANRARSGSGGGDAHDPARCTKRQNGRLPLLYEHFELLISTTLLVCGSTNHFVFDW